MEAEQLFAEYGRTVHGLCRALLRDRAEAEDAAQQTFLSAHRALLTKEWTPLEPGTIDHKYYVRGIGTVLEQTVKGGDERNALVSVHRP